MDDCYLLPELLCLIFDALAEDRDPRVMTRCGAAAQFTSKSLAAALRHGCAATSPWLFDRKQRILRQLSVCAHRLMHDGSLSPGRMFGDWQMEVLFWLWRPTLPMDTSPPPLAIRFGVYRRAGYTFLMEALLECLAALFPRQTFTVLKSRAVRARYESVGHAYICTPQTHRKVFHELVIVDQVLTSEWLAMPAIDHERSLILAPAPFCDILNITKHPDHCDACICEMQTKKCGQAFHVMPSLL